MNKEKLVYDKYVSPNKAKSLLNTSSIKSKTKVEKQVIVIPPNLKFNERLFNVTPFQELYVKLSLNTYQPFPYEEVEECKIRISNLYKRLKLEKNSHKKGEKVQSRCKYHNEVLNLYCQKDKELICVGCVYKDQKHKGHQISQLEKVFRTLNMQSEHIKSKIHSVIDTLLEWEQKIERQYNNIAQAYHIISNITDSFFQQLTNQIKRLQSQFSQTLKKNYQRTSKIVESYGETIKKTKNIYHEQIRGLSDFEDINAIIILKEIHNETGLSERLIKKTNELLNNVNIWQENCQILEKMAQKWQIQDKKVQDRNIVVTEF